ncbi:hypothetical protein RNZ50_24310 [Paracoccaceae bacterium Fryx2]|nr:hypothetical protein [Paracoccaceae bacterium Fryx2]
MMKAAGLVFCLGLMIPALAEAADFSDPEWPCIQRKVETLSAGLMWPHPLTGAALSPAAQDLVEVLSLRRVSLDAAAEQVAAFATAEPPDGQVLGAIFLGVFDKLNADRQRLIGGIARYARSQTALAAEVDRARTEMAAQEAAATPDFDRIDRLEEQIAWDERIYHDRARSLTYVCETPVLLEKRAYAIAQILLKHVPQ